MLGFKRVADLLPSNQPVYGLHVYCGTDQFDDEITVSSLAQNALNRIREVQPTGQITMLGHSAGGLIVFEAARRILEAGGPEPRVLMMDSPRPYNAFEYYWGESLLHWREKVRNPIRTLRGVTRMLFQLFISRERRSQVTSPAGDLMTLTEKHLKSIDAALKCYRAQAYNGNITLMRTRQGRAMALGRRYLGWASVTQGAVKIIDVPGAHINMLNAPYIYIVAEKLIEWLSSE
jgi:thioesterase domain-containing protein